MQETHTFRRDTMSQIIKCNPWSTRLHPNPTIIKKMKTYLELEGKLGPKLQPQTDQSRPTQPDTNPHIRKETKAIEKRKKLIPTKKYKVKVVARPKSKTNNVTIHPPAATPNAPTNLESQKPSQGGTSENNPQPLKNIPTHTGTPWPKAVKISGNLFNLMKDWLIPPTITTSKPPLKIDLQTQEQASPSATAEPKAEKCGWGPNCPICKNMEEDWDGEHQKQLQQNVSSTQPQQPLIEGLQCPQTQNYWKPQNFQHFQSQTFDVPDRYSTQLKLHKECKEKMDRLNDKYGLDASLTMNLILNQMKVKNTDMNTNTKCSSKLSKSIDIDIKKFKVQNMQNI